MNRATYTLRFAAQVQSDEDYDLFKGFFWALSAEEVCKFLETSLPQDRKMRKIILRRLRHDLSSKTANSYRHVFQSLLESIDSITSYHTKEAYHSFLFELSDLFPKSFQNELVRYSLFSRFRNPRKRAYKYLRSTNAKAWGDILEKAWLHHEDFEALPHLILYSSRQFLVANRESIMLFFDEDDLSYDFQSLLLRNQYLVKIASYAKDIIEALKESDPISYLFIKKESGGSVDPKFALEVYNQNPQSKRYLSMWLGQLGLWDTLIHIHKNDLHRRSIGTQTNSA